MVRVNRRVSFDEYLIATALTLARRHRPVWSWQRWRRICRCGNELPCHTRRAELRAEFDGATVSLALYLGAQFVAASQDLPWLPAGDLHRRFLGWLR